MTFICPNYRCSQRSQLDDALVCDNCGTNLIISNKYKLTEIVRSSPHKINSPEYCWYELFNGQGDSNEKLLIKILVIVPEALEVPSSVEDIRKVQQRFEREYRLLSKGLMGVCQGYAILDVPIEDGAITMRAIVMEKVPGINLDEYVRTYGAIDSQRALRWIKQIATTISTMHQNKVQHRDIKPSNIMVSGRGANEQLILVDFGVALDCSGSLVGDETEVVGTRPYLDPLYIAGGQYQNDSDLYSLGQTFIYLLTGNFFDPSWYEDRNIAHPPIDSKLEVAIQRMITTNPTQRFENAEKLLRYIGNRGWPKWLKRSLILAIGLIVGLLVAWLVYTRKYDHYVHPVCQINTINCGKELPRDIGVETSDIIRAFPKLSDPDPKIRQESVDTYRKIWEQYRQEPEGGELLVYWNNAMIQADESKYPEIYTLLVAVPHYRKPPGVSANILNGVAQAQKYFNEKNKDKGIQLYIAILQEPEQDDRQYSKLRKVIEDVIEKSNNSKGFIGVVGHYSSQITFNVLQLYADANMLLVSPSATRADIPNEKEQITSAHLKYFGRMISNGRNQAYEISYWLKYLLKKDDKSCGLLDMYLVYQENDTYSNSISNELKDLLFLNNISPTNNIRITNIPYELNVANTSKSEKTAANRLQSALEKASSSINPKNCSPKQVVLLFLGAYVDQDQSSVIKLIIDKIPKTADLIGNITVGDILSDPQSNLNKKGKVPTDLYPRTFIVAPFNILDFLPANTGFRKENSELKINHDFAIKMISSNSKQSKDIINISWRQIAGAESTLVFMEAIDRYTQEKERHKGEKLTTVIRDIIKREDFSAQGVFSKIQFNGYERKRIKTATMLKYIRYKSPGKEMIAVPVDYHDPNDLTKEALEYRPLTIQDLGLQD
jgi:serine/threonine protein kinase